MNANFSIDSTTPMPDFQASARLTEPAPLGSSSIVGVFDNATPAAAGVTVTERSALQLSAVWCAINLLANTIASFPLHLYRRTDGDSRERVDDHPLSELLAVRPNPAMTWYTFTQAMQSWVCSWGRGLAEIERNNAGDVVALWPITPNRVEVDLDTDGLPYYWVDGKTPLDAMDAIWLPGLGFDGLQGYSPIKLAKESLGLAAAAERYGAGVFGGDGQPSGVLTIKGKLSPQARTNMREEWKSIYGGPNKSGRRIAVLADGTTFSKISLGPEEMQFLATRQFSVIEIARWFNVPPHMLKDLSRATFSNIEEQGQDFLTYSILPWLVLWTQELGYKLLKPEDRREYYFEHTFETLMRAKVRDRYAAYAVARQWGWMSVNDVRRRENLPLIPDGDVYMVPSNMQPARNFTEPQRASKPARGLLGPDGRSIQEYLRVAA